MTSIQFNLFLLNLSFNNTLLFSNSRGTKESFSEKALPLLGDTGELIKKEPLGD